MTTPTDDLKKRDETVNTVGVSDNDAFADKTGEYPKRDYFFGSSVNKAARGSQINELFTGGGHLGVSIELPDQKASEYPYNQVQETQSGHVIEVDDTPGGERILIKHRTGSGVELRADGSVLISSKRNKVEVTGADHTVIVEGDGNLVYRGNLNVHVTGDYNLSVGGNINIENKHKFIQQVGGSRTVEVLEDDKQTIHGSQNLLVLEDKHETVYANDKKAVIGSCEIVSEGDIDLHSSKSFLATGAKEWAASSQSININGDKISVVGVTGTLGGEGVHHYGSVFWGPPLGVSTSCTFYGKLLGVASHAEQAAFSMAAVYSFAATNATNASTISPTAAVKVAAAQTVAFDAAAVVNALMLAPTPPIPPTEIPPIPPTTIAMTHASSYGIRNIDLDPGMHRYLNTVKLDDYTGLLGHEPRSMNEIRSKLRVYKGNQDNFAVNLKTKGAIGPNWSNPIPRGWVQFGRIVTADPTVKFGETPLGNNPVENNSKRFKPKRRV